MIELAHALPVSRQAELLELSRSNVYYLPRPVAEADLALMRRIDELHLNFPFAGARMLRDMLKLEGFAAGRKHVRTLMDKMGIVALYRKRSTSAAHPAHRVYPYLLKNLTIDRPNQVWASDIRYIPMRRGFVFLMAILDWATRKVLARRVSISMDGKGRWVDNVVVERLWKSVKYDHVYLHAYDSVSEAKQQLAGYFAFYNTARPHSSLGGQTPETAYFDGRAKKAA